MNERWTDRSKSRLVSCPQGKTRQRCPLLRALQDLSADSGMERVVMLLSPWASILLPCFLNLHEDVLHGIAMVTGLCRLIQRFSDLFSSCFPLDPHVDYIILLYYILYWCYLLCFVYYSHSCLCLHLLPINQTITLYLYSTSHSLTCIFILVLVVASSLLITHIFFHLTSCPGNIYTHSSPFWAGGGCSLQNSDFSFRFYLCCWFFSLLT